MEIARARPRGPFSGARTRTGTCGGGRHADAGREQAHGDPVGRRDTVPELVHAILYQNWYTPVLYQNWSAPVLYQNWYTLVLDQNWYTLVLHANSYERAAPALAGARCASSGTSVRICTGRSAVYQFWYERPRRVIPTTARRRSRSVPASRDDQNSPTFPRTDAINLAGSYPTPCLNTSSTFRMSETFADGSPSITTRSACMPAAIEPTVLSRPR